MKNAVIFIQMAHIKLRTLLTEMTKESAAEEYLSNLVKGTKWENHVYIAGGYVRDQILGKDAKDIDLVVSLPEGGIKFSEWATQKMGNYKLGSNPTIFPTFGTSKFNLKGVTYKGVDLSDMEIEAVMTRSEKYTAGSRKPEVEFGDLKADVERRDATVNSLLKKLSSGEIFDLTGKGIEDIKSGILRTPIDPDKTFEDDPLRILRMVRMSAKYNWKIPMDILRSMKKNAHTLTNISRERIHDETNKCLLSDFPYKAFRLLQILKLMKYVFPSLIDADLSNMKLMPKLKKNLVLRLIATLEKVKPTVVQSEMTSLRYGVDVIKMVSTCVTAWPDFSKKINDNMSDVDLRQYTMDIPHALPFLISYATVYAPNADMSGIEERSKAQAKELAENPMPFTGDDLISLGMKPGPKFKEILGTARKMYIRDPKTPARQYIQMAQSVINGQTPTPQ